MVIPTIEEVKDLMDKATQKKAKVDKVLDKVGKQITQAAKNNKNVVSVEVDVNVWDEVYKELDSKGFQAGAVQDPERQDVMLVSIAW